MPFFKHKLNKKRSEMQKNNFFITKKGGKNYNHKTHHET